MSKQEKQVYSALVVADVLFESEGFFVVAATPDAARARAVVEFERLFPDRVVKRTSAQPIGPESALAAGDPAEVGGRTYQQVGLLGSLADGARNLSDRDKRRRQVLR